jgi:hypothetical protein
MTAATFDKLLFNLRKVVEVIHSEINALMCVWSMGFERDHLTRAKDDVQQGREKRSAEDCGLRIADFKLRI